MIENGIRTNRIDCYMIVDKLLPRLEKVKRKGDDSWLACCPAHKDRSPSLAIREVDDRLLLHCFAGCSVYEIVSAVGLELSDLFPESREHHKPLSKPFPASEILKCLSLEFMFVYICAKDLQKGEQLTDQDFDRLKLANERIHLAVQVGGVN